MYRKNQILLFATLLAFASCKKDSNNATTTPSTTNNNTNNNNTGSTAWNWNGAKPFSAKIDGVSFVADTSTIFYVESFGYINIAIKDKDGVGLGLSIPTNAAAGQEITAPSPANLSYTDQDKGIQLSGKIGKYKIISITSTVIEGKFYVDMYDPTNTTKTTKNVTEGYFYINRQ